MPADSHCHLNHPKFDEDRAEVVARVRTAGVKYLLNVGYDIPTSGFAIELSEEYDFMYAAVGVHPHNAASLDDSALWRIEDFARHHKVVAIGEMGLDFYRNISPRDVQRRAFRAQLALAKKIGKPVIIHSRDAMDETLSILKEEDVSQIGGVMHCFPGTVDDMRRAVDMNMFISFSGNVTYPKAEGLREALAHTPGHRLLMETDSPYLAPQKKRGKRNEPTNLAEIIAKAAEVRKVTIADMERITVTNFETIFGVANQGKGEIVYKIRNSLYINVTPHCTNECYFCARYYSKTVQGHNLKIDQEPAAEEMLKEIGDPTRFDEIVFCGYGEPTLRLDEIKEVARDVKRKGGLTRLNTNGHGNHIAKRDITPELAGLIDTVSVSLNAPDAKTYEKICHPLIPDAWEKTVDFIKKGKESGLNVVATVVAIPDEVDIDECKSFVEERLGVKFRVRGHNLIG
ncbi:Uncharacterized metal-dependent hydrolase YcfH [hydrothermal vent metagenome]|uniref:Uncharacterized metal-dependent hydrolase YcfH n=1 Tax=hydrothermal vent metagenome TaxID=652676 RepID=A0A3B1BZV1_9ZZZZ